jgi:hypothetical protein
MSDALFPLRRGTIFTALGASLLLGSITAAAPPPSAASADQLYYAEQFYSDASYSVKVGAANVYCDGDYIWHWGTPSEYTRIVYRSHCP